MCWYVCPTECAAIIMLWLSIDPSLCNKMCIAELKVNSKENCFVNRFYTLLKVLYPCPAGVYISSCLPELLLFYSKGTNTTNAPLNEALGEIVLTCVSSHIHSPRNVLPPPFEYFGLVLCKKSFLDETFLLTIP